MSEVPTIQADLVSLSSTILQFLSIPPPNTIPPPIAITIYAICGLIIVIILLYVFVPFGKFWNTIKQIRIQSPLFINKRDTKETQAPVINSGKTNIIKPDDPIKLDGFEFYPGREILRLHRPLIRQLTREASYIWGLWIATA